MSIERAPILADAMDLTDWILGHFDTDTSALGRMLATESLALTRAIAIALQRRERLDQLEAADEHLMGVRVALRLAESRGLLTVEQLMYAMEHTTSVGRQIGGWLRAEGPA